MWLISSFSCDLSIFGIFFPHLSLFSVSEMFFSMKQLRAWQENEKIQKKKKREILEECVW